jgi:hypothetical protein
VNASECKGIQVNVCECWCWIRKNVPVLFLVLKNNSSLQYCFSDSLCPCGWSGARWGCFRCVLWRIGDSWLRSLSSWGSTSIWLDHEYNKTKMDIKMKQNKKVDHDWSNYMRIQIHLSALSCVLWLQFASAYYENGQVRET